MFRLLTCCGCTRDPDMRPRSSEFHRLGKLYVIAFLCRPAADHRAGRMGGQTVFYIRMLLPEGEAAVPVTEKAVV